VRRTPRRRAPSCLEAALQSWETCHSHIKICNRHPIQSFPNKFHQQIRHHIILQAECLSFRKLTRRFSCRYSHHQLLRASIFLYQINHLNYIIICVAPLSMFQFLVQRIFEPFEDCDKGRGKIEETPLQIRRSCGL